MLRLSRVTPWARPCNRLDGRKVYRDVISAPAPGLDLGRERLSPEPGDPDSRADLLFGHASNQPRDGRARARDGNQRSVAAFALIRTFGLRLPATVHRPVPSSRVRQRRATNRLTPPAYWKFESISLQRRVSSKLGSDTSAMEPGTRPLTTPVALNQVPSCAATTRARHYATRFGIRVPPCRPTR